MAFYQIGEKVLFQTDNLRVDQSTDDTAVLWLHVAGRPLNVLNRRVLADLEAAFDAVAVRPELKYLLITSDRVGDFVAGADIHEFATIRSPEEAEALSAVGQRLFDQLAGLRLCSVALVCGPCLGGGLELALACDYRVAVDHPKTQFGFPEIQLGLLPAWGGTQRLPRVVGLERSLRMILGDYRLNAKEALRWGLADSLGKHVEGRPIERQSLMALVEPAAIAQRGKPRRDGLPLRTWRQRLLESTALGRALIFRGTERLLRRRVPEDMPAPREALEAVRTGLKQGLAAGLEYERQAAGRLAASPACRNLVNLFLRREEARKAPRLAAEQAGSEIRRVGVVGAGTMGAGIAQLAALKGHEVVIHEVSKDALGAGVQRIVALFNKAAERGLLPREELAQRLGAIRGTDNWQGFDRVDLVVEAVVEDLAVKRAVFRELERRTRPAAILATNTSSLSVAALQEGLTHPGRVAGLHFFNPVHKMPLVEVVRAPATDEHTIAVLTRWAVALGKTPVMVKDSPGFVVNRILMPYLNEAVLLLAEGMGIGAIDEAMRRFGMPMGPLEVLDQVGLDVAAHIARSVQPAFGSRFDPNPALERLVERGWLGQKSGVGFYRYQGKSKRPNIAVAGLLHEQGMAASGLMRKLPLAVQLQQARERMVLLMVNEAALCLGEGLAAEASTIDLAMVLGTGWAPHRGGPLRYADDRGLRSVVQTLTELAQRLGPRFEPCAELRQRAETGKPFHEQPATVARRFPQ